MTKCVYKMHICMYIRFEVFEKEPPKNCVFLIDKDKNGR